MLSLQLSSTLSGTFASRRGRRRRAPRRRRARDRHADRLGGDRDARASRVQRRLERGTTDEEIDALSTATGATHGLLFTVDTLEYLARGGRIGRAAALAGALLNVKPILTIEDGEVVPLKRVRGSQKALDEFRALFEAGSSDAPSLRVGLAHAAAPDRLARARGARRGAPGRAPRSRSSTSLGAVVGTHAGPGTLGLFWFDDPE